MIGAERAAAAVSPGVQRRALRDGELRQVLPGHRVDGSEVRPAGDDRSSCRSTGAKGVYDVDDVDVLPVALLAAAALVAAGCRQDMHDAPRYEALEASASFADGRSSRTPPAGTVARGWLRDDEALYTGKVDGAARRRSSRSRSAHDELARGQRALQHLLHALPRPLGDGNGMVVQRGLRQAAVVPPGPPAPGAGRLLLRRDHQRLRRHAGLRGADSGRAIAG